jgi:glycosyltransferase involved in cell wall biosynthesis
VSRIVFASTYPPRSCGIATFTADLGRAIGAREIVALRHPEDQGRFGPEVHHVVRTDVLADHTRVARSLDTCGVRMVNVQHAYDIWGGEDGTYVLDFLDALTVPAVATLHTVLREPSDAQRRIMRGILDGTQAVVAMSQAAATVLTEEYGADRDRVAIIPHGVPDLPLVSPETAKPAVGQAGRSVLLTFGLLGPSKGCETVIEAMPAIVSAVPDATYVILGATHPELLRTEGERYRRSLETLVAKLHLTRNVLFVDRFVGRLELGNWLEAADVFVTPYPDLDKVVSGTLSYAMAAGKASVSTPYPFASELLAGGRGRIVPAPSPAAMADAIVELLLDPVRRATMSQRAYEHGRTMTWSNVAAQYAQLFARLGTSSTVRPVAQVAVHSA